MRLRRTLRLALLALAAASGVLWAEVGRLEPPPKGRIPVAALLSEGATVIDFAGPWEVFQDAMVAGRGDDLAAFRLYTVAESTKPIRASGGLQVVPDYVFANAPPPKVIVIPAQSAPTPAVLAWLRKSAAHADLVMSVCTGSFVLARAGLLDGGKATTHHSAYAFFEQEFPRVKLQRGSRFVEAEHLATAGGLTSGIDLALRVVERYFGRPTAERTAYYMEYQGAGWRDASGAANQAYASGTLPPGTTICPTCRFEIPEGHLTLRRDGKDYSFCSPDCRKEFENAPDGGGRGSR